MSHKKIQLKKEDIEEGHIFNCELTGKELVIISNLFQRVPPDTKFGEMRNLQTEIEDVALNLQKYCELDTIKANEKEDTKKDKEKANDSKLKGLEININRFKKDRNLI